jgi:hypothetical protein
VQAGAPALGLSFDVIAEVLILAPMESVCGTINMSSVT